MEVGGSAPSDLAAGVTISVVLRRRSALIYGTPTVIRASLGVAGSMLFLSVISVVRSAARLAVLLRPSSGSGVPSFPLAHVPFVSVLGAGC